MPSLTNRSGYIKHAREAFNKRSEAALSRSHQAKSTPWASSTYVQQRQFDDFAKLFERFFATSDVVVCNIRLLLHGHHRDGGIDLGRQGDLDLVLGSVNARERQEINISHQFVNTISPRPRERERERERESARARERERERERERVRVASQAKSSFTKHLNRKAKGRSWMLSTETRRQHPVANRK